MATVTDETLPDPTFHLVEAHDHDHGSGGGTLLGFWIYLMSDALLFAAVFASFGVLSTPFFAWEPSRRRPAVPVGPTGLFSGIQAPA